MHGPTEFFDVSRFNLAIKLERALFVVCISDFTRSQLMAHCAPELWDKLHVVHVGIPLEQFTNRAGARPEPTEPTILTIGRHVPEKGQGLLLEAAAMLLERRKMVNVTLAGDGAARADLERLAERLGLAARTSFPGAVGQDDLRALYADATIFCLPSFAEGTPGVLMEAMAMELPVISTRITGVPEIIDDGRTGLLVPPGRVDLLTDALERLLDDPALRRQIGAAARATIAREFETEKSAEELLRLFTSELKIAPSTAPRAESDPPARRPRALSTK